MNSKLYTGTGDQGTTSLVGGERVKKASARLEAYGTLDEFSSFLGIIAAEEDCPDELRHQILQIQNSLFDAGCYLATSVAEGENPLCRGIGNDAIAEVERWIDALDSATPKINKFILPGGSLIAAHCHVARTVCRRAERRILALAEEEYVDPALLRWINRLSDYLFIAARNLNYKTSHEEIVWQPGK